MNRIRVLIADDDEAMRDALADVVREERRFEFVGAARDADEAIALAKEHRPDVALLDVKMPGGGGMRAAGEIIAAVPRVALLALSAHEDDASVHEMLANGVTSYLVKGTSVEAIVAAIANAAGGKATLSPQVAAGVVRQFSRRLRTEQRDERREQRQVERVTRAIRGEGLAMVFQPIFELAEQRIVGFEALSRFDEEPSNPFIWFTQAAAVGMGTDLELAAVRHAFASLPALPSDAFLSVNVSPETAVSPRFARELADVPTDRVVVEITEEARVADYPRLKAALQELRGRGVSLAVDDAGAGFASLRHILELDPRYIKLDITLTRDVDVERSRRALTASLAAFARETGATIVAEGIETQQELEALVELGVTHGQGFLLARPQPLESWMLEDDDAAAG